MTEDEEIEFVDAPSEPDEELRVDSEEEPEFDPSKKKQVRRSSTKSFVTASTQLSDLEGAPPEQEPEEASRLQVPTSQEEDGQKALGKRPVSTVESSNGGPPGSTVGEPSVDAVSTTSLLRKADVNKAEPDVGLRSPPPKGIIAKVKRRSQQRSSGSGLPMDQAEEALDRTKSNLRNLVKFDLPEDSKRASLHLKAKAAQMTIQRASTKLRRQKVPDGLVVKMERMLVRVDSAGKEVPAEFDENSNQKIDSRVKDKWREYMIVCRQSISEDADFVLQMYKTRVIPEIEEKNASKKAAFEIPLGRKITKVRMLCADTTLRQ